MKPKQQNEKQQKNRRKTPKQEILQQMKAKQKKRSTANLEITEENINTKNIEEPKYIFFTYISFKDIMFSNKPFFQFDVFFFPFFSSWHYIMFVDVSSVSSGFFPVFLRWPSAFLLRYARKDGYKLVLQFLSSFGVPSAASQIYPWTFPLTSSRQKRTRCCHLGFPKKQSTKKPKEHETWKTQKKET